MEASAPGLRWRSRLRNCKTTKKHVSDISQSKQAPSPILLILLADDTPSRNETPANIDNSNDENQSGNTVR